MRPGDPRKDLYFRLRDLAKKKKSVQWVSRSGSCMHVPTESANGETALLFGSFLLTTTASGKSEWPLPVSQNITADHIPPRLLPSLAGLLETLGELQPRELILSSGPPLLICRNGTSICGEGGSGDAEMYRSASFCSQFSSLMSRTQSESDSMDVDFSRSSFHSSPVSPVSAAPTPAFAATSAEFHLFPKNNRTTDRKRRATHHTESALDLDFSTAARTADLTRLRSDAFWQLQRSVEENGEGFVKSMRVYETRRSRASVYLKVKEAQRRGRRRSPVHSPTVDARNESGDEDDDVQIFAGEPVTTSFTSRGKQRAFSAGTAFPRSDRCSSPGATCDSSSSMYLSDDDAPHIPAPSMQLSPALSHTFSHSANSSESLISLNLPPPSAISASRSEKAIAALSLAMANGAGGLDDYAVLRSLHTSSPDNCEVGEMWH